MKELSKEFQRITGKTMKDYEEYCRQKNISSELETSKQKFYKDSLSEYKKGNK